MGRKWSGCALKGTQPQRLPSSNPNGQVGYAHKLAQAQTQPTHRERAVIACWTVIWYGVQQSSLAIARHDGHLPAIASPEWPNQQRQQAAGWQADLPYSAPYIPAGQPNTSTPQCWAKLSSRASTERLGIDRARLGEPSAARCHTKEDVRTQAPSAALTRCRHSARRERGQRCQAGRATSPHCALKIRRTASPAHQ